MNARELALELFDYLSDPLYWREAHATFDEHGGDVFGTDGRLNPALLHALRERANGWATGNDHRVKAQTMPLRVGPRCGAQARNSDGCVLNAGHSELHSDGVCEWESATNG